MSEYDEDRDDSENQARALFEIAAAIRGLLYGLKYSTGDGMSIAEAIAVGADKIAAAVGGRDD